MRGPQADENPDVRAAILAANPLRPRDERRHIFVTSGFSTRPEAYTVGQWRDRVELPMFLAYGKRSLKTSVSAPTVMILALWVGVDCS